MGCAACGQKYKRPTTRAVQQRVKAASNVASPTVETTELEKHVYVPPRIGGYNITVRPPKLPDVPVGGKLVKESPDASEE